MTSKPRMFSGYRRGLRTDMAGLTLKALPLAVALCFCPILQADVINPNITGLPLSGTVAAGTVTGGVTGNKLALTQSTQRAVIDWQSFNIAAGKEVQFIQPNASAAVLNRVSASSNMSEIYGTLSANGTVLLMNPNGVLFSQGASINVGSLIVTTGTINQSSFMAERAFEIAGATTGSIVNQGSITAANAGLVALVAPSVSNQGVISASRGTVLLGGVSAATISLSGGLYEFVTGSTAAAPGARVSNSGSIQADGGNVFLTAASASAIVDSVINMDGIIQARSVGTREGAIVLEAGDAGGVQVAGLLDATGAQGSKGGKIRVTGNAVDLTATARLDASGDTGGGTVLVGGNWQGQGPQRNAQTTMVAAGASIHADALTSGNGGMVVVWSDDTTRFSGSISARGGAVGGDGGAVEVSGKQALGFAGMVDTRATNGNTGSLLLDPVYAVISGDSSGTAGNTETINAASLVSNLNNTNVTIQADSTVTVNTAVNASGNANAHNLALNAPTVDLNAVITLKTGAALSGTASAVNVNGSNARIQNGVDVAASGATVNVAAGTYNEQVSLNKANLALSGATGAKLNVADNTNGITIAANNDTVQGLELAGPVTSSYLSYNWGSNVSRGVMVGNGITGFAIRNNNIHDVRNGILIDGRNGVGNAVTGNRIENTKSGISVQYTDANGITIANNSEGSIGNEWGLNLHLNGFLDGGTIQTNPYQAAPTAAWQQSLLNLSATNNNWAVQDQGYQSSNRTVVNVATTGAASNQGTLLAPLNTIQGGVNAVVAGGKVNVQAGTYAESVTLNNPYNLRFSDATLQGLTLNAGAANSSIGGQVTTSGANGITFNGAVNLLADTTLTANGGNIGLNGLIQNSGGTVRALTLTATSGGSSTAGNVTLSSDNDVTTTVVADGRVTLTGRSINGSARAATLTANATNTINMALDVGAANVRAGVQADLTGRVASIGINTPRGNLTGSFSNVDNTGNGIIFVNGRPLQSDAVAAVINNIRIIPVIVLPSLPPPLPAPPPAPVTLHASVDITAEPPTATGTGGGGGPTSTSTPSTGGNGARATRSTVVAAVTGTQQVQVTRSSPRRSGSLLDRGQGAEIDLTPGN